MKMMLGLVSLSILACSSGENAKKIRLKINPPVNNSCEITIHYAAKEPKLAITVFQKTTRKKFLSEESQIEQNLWDNFLLRFDQLTQEIKPTSSEMIANEVYYECAWYKKEKLESAVRFYKDANQFPGEMEMKDLIKQLALSSLKNEIIKNYIKQF